jgi:hypothetical protein
MEVRMTLDRLLRDVIDSGRLRETFSAAEATWAVDRQDWPVSRVHSFLVRYCSGNLAARQLLFERVSFGRYRLLVRGKADRGCDHAPARRGWTARWPADRPQGPPESER